MATVFENLGMDSEVGELLREVTRGLGHWPAAGELLTWDLVMASSTVQGGIPMRVAGHRALYKLKVTSLEERVAGASDLRLTIDGLWWTHKTDDQRRALLHQVVSRIEFMEQTRDDQAHIEGLRLDDAGRPRIKIKPLDFVVQGMWETVKTHSDEASEVRALQQVCGEVRNLTQKVFWG